MSFEETKILAKGKYLGLYLEGTWEFAERPNSHGCVGILPITDDGHLVLIGQYRIPMQAKVIEIPAGLTGDEEEFSHESLVESAARELSEETGYRAGVITHLLSSPTSAGMVREMTHLYAATSLVKETEGGGTEDESITVYNVPLDQLNDFLSEKEKSGYLIDFKIHASLLIAQQKGII